MSAATVTVAPAEDEAPPATRGRLKLMIIGLVVLLAVGAAAYTFLLAPDSEASEDAAPVEGEIVPLAAQTTTTGTSTMHHARVAVALVLSEGADPTAIEERAPLLQDALLGQVATMSADQLRSPEGSNQLRAALTEQAQTIWVEGEVIRVVLTELLVQ